MPMPTLPRTAADDQLVPARITNPARRRRSRTTTGYSHSVPQSAINSENEDSSDDDDEDVVEINNPTMPFTEKEATPQPEEVPLSPLFHEFTMHTIDQMDPLSDMSLPDFTPDIRDTSDTTDQSTWSGQHSPPRVENWSSAATTTTASPTSSHLSVSDYMMQESPLSTIGRRDGSNMIGKSAWGPADWMSANPRLDPSGASTSSNSSLVGGPSPPPSSPFSFSHMSHGIMDRYDLFQNSSFVHDFASEMGLDDTHSTFSDPELFPSQSMRGFTHHSNYAGDLIFGTRTHQPQFSLNSLSSLAFSQSSSGLGLTGMVQSGASINPMQLHTPSLPGIDELEMHSIRLDDADEVDNEPLISSVSTVETGNQENVAEIVLPFGADLSSIIHLPPQTLEEIAGLTSDVSGHLEQDMATTPPATPAQSSRMTRDLHSSQLASMHTRSMSVPPFERVTMRPQQQGHATPQPGPSRSLSLFDIPVGPLDSDNTSLSNSSLQSTSFLSLPINPEPFKPIDLSELIFLDLHYPDNGYSPQHHEIIESSVEETRNGQALDLAQSHGSGAQHSSAPGTGTLNAHPSSPSQEPGKTVPTHHRGQSAVSPKELVHQCDNKRKRASWDGGLPNIS